MARVYSVDLGGKVREFRFTDSERDYLETRFGRGLLKIVQEMVLANDEQGRPTLGGVRAAQVALVWSGLRYYGNAVTETKVAQWMHSQLAEKGTYFDVVAQAVMAVYASGVLGARWESAEDDEAAEGKAEPVATPEE